MKKTIIGSSLVGSMLLGMTISSLPVLAAEPVYDSVVTYEVVTDSTYTLEIPEIIELNHSSAADLEINVSDVRLAVGNKLVVSVATERTPNTNGTLTLKRWDDTTNSLTASIKNSKGILVKDHDVVAETADNITTTRNIGKLTIGAPSGDKSIAGNYSEILTFTGSVVDDK